MPKKIILDVDTGTDDAVALLVAALSPDLELIGATTVNGNCPVNICTENTLRVFSLISTNLPVFQGCIEPLCRENPVNDRDWTQILPFFPEQIYKKQATHAVDWLIETYRKTTDEIILVPLGPLTNIAMALRLAPDIAKNIPEIVMMGGGFEIGNSTPASEFNIWVDPEAARIVFGSKIPIHLITLDATHKALISFDDCRQLRASGQKAAIAAAETIEDRINRYDETQPMKILGCAPVHDALAVCAILDPTVVTSYDYYVDIETYGELTLGQTVIDASHRSKFSPNCLVALDSDDRKFASMLIEILGKEK